MRRLLLILSALAVVLTTTDNAQSTSLADLVRGQSITVNDKLFDQWTVVFNEVSDLNRQGTVDLNNIDVTGLTDGGTNPGPGLMFTASNNELSVAGDGIYSYLDLQIGFHVSVTDPAWLIKDNSLALGSASLIYPGQTNDSGVYVRETVGTAPGLDDLGVKDVEFSVLDGALTTDLTDAVQFTSLSEIYVTKNILLWATEIGDAASLLSFEQRFSQTPVPEPGTITLLGLGLAGLGARVRRKKA